MDLLDETNELIDRRENKRPVFLLVLCILTWVSCGMSLVTGLIQLFSYSAMSKITSGVAGLGDNYAALMFWSAIVAFTTAIICAIGAVLMFKLKKIGFFIYLFGQLILMGFTVYSTFANKIIGFGGFFGAIGLVSLIFPIAFIVMYGIHYKHLK